AVRWAQDHLRILSGLYGVLRPLDEIEPYRLEMGSRVASERGTNLYAFWKGHIAPLLAQDAAQAQTDTLVNCASEEYFGAVDQAALGLTIITPKFYDIKNGTPKIVSFWAKKARGAMARYIVEHRLTNPKDLIDFDTGGYAYDCDLSTPTAPAFVRNPDS
ncbi:MAG: peroxide stress protein YaaA, partial [Paracoccaceae bacterium]